MSFSREVHVRKAEESMQKFSSITLRSLFSGLLVVGAIALTSCSKDGQSDTVVPQGRTDQISTGQVGVPGSTRVRDANTRTDANAADDLGQGNSMNQPDATVSGTTLSGAETGKREVPRVINGNKKGSGSGMVNQPTDGGTKTKPAESAH